jgi:hypothetical protein
LFKPSSVFKLRRPDPVRALQAKKLFEMSTAPNFVVGEFESKEANVAVLNQVTVALLRQLAFSLDFSF